jgi:DMSO/TMAO reductase YedYZ molybdopterin-dependent catalytic subunit
MSLMSRIFQGRRPDAELAKRLPPGQHRTDDFPVLSMGPTPRLAPAAARLDLKIGPRIAVSWSLDELKALPQKAWRRDIHCVTTWSKFDTFWEGITVDDIFTAAGVEPPTGHLLAHSADGYSTNLLLSDLTDGKAMVAFAYDGRPIAAEHGGPIRLLVPHLYFWKSAKWLTGLQFTEKEELGFWELRGYHRRGDPFAEERYSDA